MRTFLSENMERISLIVLLLATTTVRADKLSFNRDVRPILSDKCFKCHGPDAKNQKSEFRLDTFEHATADLDGVTGVVPGELKKSEVHWRIHNDDAADLMPPPEAKMRLSAAEIATIDRWIEEGAEYEQHWSFVPVPDSVDVPENSSAGDRPSGDRPSGDRRGWTQNEIDAFILARLEKEGFSPSPETSREKWIRRVTFDLTGLPPTPAEVDAFIADTSPEAFGEIVDRLFKTEFYAERMAAEWLDVARYSDSYGFQVDRDRNVWQWRDWVIRSFKENLPYDDFITWQLAGDLLPNPTRDQILATTFNRLHPQKVEGGSVPEEFRVEYVSDRLHTYGTAFLGLTMECCRCHDHKYDPIKTKEYYEMSSFFANIDEAGLYSFFTPSVPTPTLWLPTEEQEKNLATLQSEIAQAEKGLSKIADAAKSDFESATKEESPFPEPIASVTFEESEKLKLANNKLVPGKTGKAVKLTGDDGVKLKVGNFTRDDPFSVSLWLQTPDQKHRAVVFSRSKAWTDAASRGYELLIEHGKLSFALIHFYPGNAIRVTAKDQLPVGEWKHVTVTYDGSSRASGVGLYVDGKPIKTETVRDNLTREIVGGGSDTIVIGQRMRDNGFKNGLVDDFKVFDRELTPREIDGVNTAPDIQTYLARADEAYSKQFEKLTALRKQRSEVVKAIPEIMAMAEKKTPRQSYILNRGAYTNRGEPVSPATPEWLNTFPDDAPANRLGLARWTVDPSNPLTARVAVNRYWQMLFGTGLVSTSEDFGSQGRPPTHPELLDWLARDFIDHGWDLRHLLKQIALSATYRQSSDIESGEYTSRDPENHLLYRYPAPRLTAEMMRDNALAVSGLLVEKFGGPSVKPYDIAVSFKPSKPGKGDDLYRRSLYTYWKQTAPAPMMTTLNASKRDVCRVRLERTDSPLQGLVLLNSPQFVEAARHLAENLVTKHGTNDDALIDDAFLRLTSRRPNAEEKPILNSILTEQQSHFSGSPGSAKKLLDLGDSPASESENLAHLAAVTTLVSTLMNFDESITKR